MKSPTNHKGETSAMLQEEFNTKILGLSNVLIEDVQESEGKMHIRISTKKSGQKCPCCGEETSYVHDYSAQKNRLALKILLIITSKMHSKKILLTNL